MGILDTLKSIAGIKTETAQAKQQVQAFDPRIYQSQTQLRQATPYSQVQVQEVQRQRSLAKAQTLQAVEQQEQAQAEYEQEMQDYLSTPEGIVAYAQESGIQPSVKYETIAGASGKKEVDASGKVIGEGSYSYAEKQVPVYTYTTPYGTYVDRSAVEGASVLPEVESEAYAKAQAKYEADVQKYKEDVAEGMRTGAIPMKDVYFTSESPLGFEVRPITAAEAWKNENAQLYFTPQGIEIRPPEAMQTPEYSSKVGDIYPQVDRFLTPRQQMYYDVVSSPGARNLLALGAKQLPGEIKKDAGKVISFLNPIPEEAKIAYALYKSPQGQVITKIGGEAIASEVKQAMPYVTKFLTPSPYVNVFTPTPETKMVLPLTYKLGKSVKRYTNEAFSLLPPVQGYKAVKKLGPYVMKAGNWYYKTEVKPKLEFIGTVGKVGGVIGSSLNKEVIQPKIERFGLGLAKTAVTAYPYVVKAKKAYDFVPSKATEYLRKGEPYFSKVSKTLSYTPPMIIPTVVGNMLGDIEKVRKQQAPNETFTDFFMTQYGKSFEKTFTEITPNIHFMHDKKEVMYAPSNIFGKGVRKYAEVAPYFTPAGYFLAGAPHAERVARFGLGAEAKYVKEHPIETIFDVSYLAGGAYRGIKKATQLKVKDSLLFPKTKGGRKVTQKELLALYKKGEFSPGRLKEITQPYREWLKMKPKYSAKEYYQLVKSKGGRETLAKLEKSLVKSGLTTTQAKKVLKGYQLPFFYTPTVRVGGLGTLQPYGSKYKTELLKFARTQQIIPRLTATGKAKTIQRITAEPKTIYDMWGFKTKVSAKNVIAISQKNLPYGMKRMGILKTGRVRAPEQAITKMIDGKKVTIKTGGFLKKGKLKEPYLAVSERVGKNERTTFGIFKRTTKPTAKVEIVVAESKIGKAFTRKIPGKFPAKFREVTTTYYRGLPLNTRFSKAFPKIASKAETAEFVKGLRAMPFRGTPLRVQKTLEVIQATGKKVTLAKKPFGLILRTTEKGRRLMTSDLGGTVRPTIKVIPRRAVSVIKKSKGIIAAPKVRTYKTPIGNLEAWEGYPSYVGGKASGVSGEYAPSKIFGYKGMRGSIESGLIQTKKINRVAPLVAPLPSTSIEKPLSYVTKTSDIGLLGRTIQVGQVFQTQVPAQKLLQVQKPVLAESLVFQPTTQVSKPVQDIFTGQKVTQTQVQVPALKVIEVPQFQVPTVTVTPRRTITERTRPTPPPSPPTPPTYYPRPDEDVLKLGKPRIKPRKKGLSFEVAIRKKGKKIKVSPFGLSYGEALTFGARATRRGAQATFELIPSSKPAKTLGLRPTTELALRKSYRKPIRKGREIVSPFTFIERKRQRITTRAEKAAISFAGIKSRRSKWWK